MRDKVIGLLITIALITLVAVFFLFLLGQSNVQNRDKPETITAYCDCNFDVFKEEYNLSHVYPHGLVHNGTGYCILNDYNKDLEIPIYDLNCSLNTNEEEVQRILKYKKITDYLSKEDEKIYDNLAICYSVSGGAKPICEITTTTKEVVDNPIVETAVEHEGVTVYIVNDLAPHGWKKESIDATKKIIKLTKEIKGPSTISLVFDVVDTTSCTLADSIAVSIYDYSIVSSDIWYLIKHKNTYDGIETDLKTLNSGLITLMSNPDWKTMVNNLAGVVFGGQEDCNLNALDSFEPKLEAINNEMSLGERQGEIVSENYLDWIVPIKNNTTEIKIQVDGEMANESNILSFLLITKIPDIFERDNTYNTANDLYSQGLYFSAEQEYYGTLDGIRIARETNIFDYIISFVVWGLILFNIALFVWPRYIS